METYTQLLILQLIAHLLADFIFQSDLWARHKRRFGFRSRILYWHIIIVFALSFLFSFRLNFIFPALMISIFHLVIDGFKSNMGNVRFRKKKPFQKMTFFIDQLLHLFVISLTIFIFTNIFGLEQKVIVTISNHYLLIILGYLLCLKPTNILIKEIFTIYNIKITLDTKDDLLNAGKLIGNIERILALTLLLIGQYEAIGFIIAGKSILRYEGKKTSKTEYVLIGTLLSFGIAILIGVTIIKLNY